MNKNVFTKTRTISLLPTLLLLVISLSSTSILSAQREYDLVQTTEVMIESSILDEMRFASIYLPPNYEKGSQKYPVLYLLDGRTHLHHASGAVSFLSNMGIIPQMIVVAVHNVDRNRDFSPVHDERIPTSGGADKFLSYLSSELSPYMKDNYRVSDFSILMGHSFGGTFVSYTLLTKPKLFDAYIAISPYNHYADNYIVEEAKIKLKSEYKGQKYFYMTVGDEPDYFSALDEFSSLIKEKSGDAIDFKYEKMESENHGTIPYLSLFNGLKFVFSDWQLTRDKLGEGLDAVDAHYKRVSSKYGMKINAPENIINLLGYNYLQNGDIEMAIEVFIENVKRYSKSPNVYDSLGEAYENDNQLELAEKNYKKAFELGTKQSNVNTPIYKINLDRVRGE